jgi:predicted transcriptional regulator
MLPEIEEISRRRRILNLSQKQLAKLAGVSQSMIAKIEAGKINPSYSKTKAIFDTLESLERKRDILVKEILNSNVVGVDKRDSVSKAVKLMRENNFSQLPVFDGIHVVGSVSEKTILDQILRGRNLSELSAMPVETIMEEAFPRVEENTPLTAVSTLLQYAPAVLITRRDQVVGIVTKADLLKVVHANML